MRGQQTFNTLLTSKKPRRCLWVYARIVIVAGDMRQLQTDGPIGTAGCNLNCQRVCGTPATVDTINQYMTVPHGAYMTMDPPGSGHSSQGPSRSATPMSILTEGHLVPTVSGYHSMTTSRAHTPAHLHIGAQPQFPAPIGYPERAKSWRRNDVPSEKP